MPIKRHLFGYTQRCPVSTRLTKHQIVVHEGCFKEKPRHKKLRPLSSPQFDPQAYDGRRAMINKCIIDRRKSLFVLIEYNAKSMQALQHACSVAFFQLFARICITFERKITFTLNLVDLCQIISSTSHTNLKWKFLFLADLLRIR